jgi:CBS domain-containing protein
MNNAKKIDGIFKREARVVTVTGNSSVTKAARLMREHNIGSAVVVTETGKIFGIISERDILAKVVAEGKDPQTTLVRSVMTADVITCHMDMTIAQAQQIMAQHGIRHLPIVKDDIPLGMISSRDVLSHQLQTTMALARKQSRLINELEREYPGITNLHTDHAGRIVI